LTDHTDRVCASTVLSYGSLVSCSVDKTIKIWDAKNGQIIKNLTSLSYDAYILSVLPETLNNIGLVLKNQGKNDEALVYFNKSLDIYRKVFGTEEHSSIATTLNNIGSVLENQGKNDEALVYYNKSLDINRKVFGTEEHSSIATTLNNIGSVLENQGKNDEALVYFNKSLDIL
jgi:tetratricopeptide (TPR) repeat protein